MKNKKLIIVVMASVAVLGILFFAAAKMFKSSESERLAFIANSDFKKFVPDYAIRKGSPEAKVYVVEFFDPECESCREFHPYMHSILSDYAGKIQVVMRYAPFHGNSIFAIKILEAARKQDRYWEALEILFQHQPEWGNHHNPRPELVWNYLPRLNIDVERIKQDMEDPQIQEIIKKDMDDVQALGVKATPTFFVNGKVVDQFGPDHLRAAIEKELTDTSGH